MPTSKVNGYLVTGSDWLDLRDQTAHVMVFDEHLNQFLANAGQFGLAVQRIEGSGDDEHYQTLVGPEADGWTPQKALRYLEAQSAEARTEHDELLGRLLENAPMRAEFDGDDDQETIVVHYVGWLEAERDRLAQLAAEILASYARTGDGYRGRAGQVQVARWRDQLGGSR